MSRLKLAPTTSLVDLRNPLGSCGIAWELGVDLVNPPPAEHHIPFVEDDGLAGRNGGLGIVEDELGALVVESPHAPRRGVVAMPDLRRRGAPGCRRVNRDPVHA